VELKRLRALSKTSDEQLLALAARQHRDLIAAASTLHLKTQKLTAALQNPIEQQPRPLGGSDFHSLRLHVQKCRQAIGISIAGAA